ncbi:hypothetical protein BGW36DRAFT_426406 [Talaromyces proteolyticus]|uniref:Zn(2)-C6 fungal-type domain-containing protein n=1 Tax=Talaromyces proteolyticus TaxID=1131652 RepID=A0AAD4Q1H2_9EURO|nr:uncharacterized protein BGW36DRAFT_426406 [Talaromyces proteolyticus]KAH8698714.1 hypothetical protein BGW36DRAFT_426406 [Talaromyces proteolyticus]
MLRHRACEECKRKTRCDMKQPCCSLCGRVGSTCVYPSPISSRHRGWRSKLAFQTTSSTAAVEYLTDGQPLSSHLLDDQHELDGHILDLMDYMDGVADDMPWDADFQTLNSNVSYDLDARHAGLGWIPSGRVLQDFNLNGKSPLKNCVAPLASQPPITQISKPKLNGVYYSLSVPDVVANTLIETFFERAHHSVPILHHPTF